MTPHIRPRRATDADALYAIYFSAVRDGTARYYSEAQRRAWAPSATPPPHWPEKLAELDTLVADIDDAPAGFLAAAPGGYIDLFFVAPAVMGKGVAQALYEHFLAGAREQGLTRLTAHASHLAHAFFSRNGWQVDAPERLDRNGEILERFAMSLSLDHGP